MKNAPTSDGNGLESFTSNWVGVGWMDGRENPFIRPQTQPGFLWEKQCFFFVRAFTVEIK